MRRLIFIIPLICYAVSIMAVQINKPKTDYISKQSIYQAQFNCDQVMSVGDFQNCQISLFKDDKKVRNSKIHLTGSMTGHNHGLPTSPKVVWSGENQTYLIEGLKFSMPGKWLLNLNINATDDSLKDTIVIPVMVE